MYKKRTIQNCKFEFKFKCPLNWILLKKTDDENVRFCIKCEEKVYFCSSDEDTLTHVKAGHCIAREITNELKIRKIVFGRLEEPDL